MVKVVATGVLSWTDWYKLCVAKLGHSYGPLVAAMQQIADWLKKLGLAQYVQAFADNDIDFSVLHHLTDQHLKDLGVSLGHRLKMLQAIRDLGEASFAASSSAVHGRAPGLHR
jgi:hypothetical protein